MCLLALYQLSSISIHLTVVSSLFPVPSGPPLNVKVVHKSAKGISLSWSEPAQPNGKIVYYQVFYRLASATKPEKYLTDSEHHNFENLEPFREYILQVTAATSKGSGPYSKELRVRTDPDSK